MNDLQFQNPSQADIAKLLSQSKRIAVVGLSADPLRPSFQVAKYLLGRQYDIIPVNPAAAEIMGLKAYPNLSDIGGRIDIVDVFRRSDQTDPIIDEAIRIGAKAIWLQEQVVNDTGALRAQKAGLVVVQDRCIKKELMKIE